MESETYGSSAYATGSSHRTWAEARNLLNQLKTCRQYFPVVGLAGMPSSDARPGRPPAKGKSGKGCPARPPSKGRKSKGGKPGRPSYRPRGTTDVIRLRAIGKPGRPPMRKSELECILCQMEIRTRHTARLEYHTNLAMKPHQCIYGSRRSQRPCQRLWAWTGWRLPGPP